MSEGISPKPCPHCGVLPDLVNIAGGFTKAEAFYVVCSNQIDCPIWPETGYSPNREAAVAAWNGDLVSTS